MSMKLRIWKAKLNLYKYLQDLSEDSLAKEIFNEQKKKNFPGLVQECWNIAKELDIMDELNNDKMNKMHFNFSEIGNFKEKLGRTEKRDDKILEIERLGGGYL